MKEIKDVRQSEEWSKFLSFFGWECYRTNIGINVACRKFLGRSFVKVQRPHLLQTKDLREIEKICRREKALFIKIEPNIGQNIDILEKEGYIKSYFPYIPPKTIIMDLTKSENDLWNDISRSGKYSIRRAEREKARVEFVRNPNKKKLEIYHELHVQTGRRKGFYVAPQKELEAVVKQFKDNAHLVFVYGSNNEIEGAKLYVCSEDHVLYLHGGTTDSGRKTKSGYELVWKSILYFKSLGFKTLDLEGVDDKRFPSFTKGWGGFAYFKEKFGGTVVEFPYPYVKYLNPLFRSFSRLTPFGGI